MANPAVVGVPTDHDLKLFIKFNQKLMENPKIKYEEWFYKPD